MSEIPCVGRRLYVCDIMWVYIHSGQVENDA